MKVGLHCLRLVGRRRQVAGGHCWVWEEACHRRACLCIHLRHGARLCQRPSARSRNCPPIYSFLSHSIPILPIQRSSALPILTRLHQQTSSHTTDPPQQKLPHSFVPQPTIHDYIPFFFLNNPPPPKIPPFPQPAPLHI